MAVAAAVALAISVSACGSSTDDAINGVRQVINNASPPPAGVPEQQLEAATIRTACDALDAYGSDGAQLSTDLIAGYAQLQQLGSEDLYSYDSTISSELADALDAVGTTQEASEVASELC
jgi:hypothetical protein